MLNFSGTLALKRSVNTHPKQLISMFAVAKKASPVAFPRIGNVINYLKSHSRVQVA